MKFTGILAAVAVLGLSASSFAAPVALNLDLQVNEGAKTWQVFGSISGDTARTLGLSGFSLDVIGTGGIVVSSSANNSPQGAYFQPSPFVLFPTGFITLRSDGTLGIDIQGAQPSTSYQTNNTFPGSNNILEGVGLVGKTEDTATWAHPVLLASGSYTGVAGLLTVQALTNDVNFLPATLPTPTPAGVGVATFSPDSVTGDSQIVGIPEPASLGVLALGGLALLARRRKAC